jgi:RimJ/RimL family protein N-acetyltransferase
MQEAMAAFIPELQQRLALARLVASVERENSASLKLLDKFKFEHVDTTIEDGDVHLFKLHKSFHVPEPA